MLSAHAAPPSVFIEELTWPEVSDAVAAKHGTALYYAGSTEQNGPHMATGKHNWIARDVTGRIARELGNALAYPVMPFAPTGDASAKTAHMAYPGSVTVSDATFGAVAREVAQSAASAGFKCIVLMGDHGGGQAALAGVAQALTAAWKARGIKVIYAGEVYERANDMAMAWLKEKGLPYGDHASIIDTSELMFVMAAGVRMEQRAQAGPDNGSSGHAQLATVALGEKFIGFKVQAAVEKIRSPAGCGR